jgi:hypothetical protein
MRPLRYAHTQIQVHVDKIAGRVQQQWGLPPAGPPMLTPMQGVGIFWCACLGAALVGSMAGPGTMLAGLAILMPTYLYILHTPTRDNGDWLMQACQQGLARLFNR